MNNAAIITTSGTISMFLNGRSHSIHTGHPNYKEIVEALKVEDYEKVADLLDVKTQIESWMGDESEVCIKGDDFYYNGQRISNRLADRILQMKKDGFSFQPMVNLFVNIEANTSMRLRRKIYDFCEANNLPITQDGCIVMYKIVTSDFKDLFTKTIDNSPGRTVSMNPSEVDDEDSNTCSRGFHGCSRDYLPEYGNVRHGTDKVVAIKVNPSHIMAIPNDYNNAKIRMYEYHVLAHCADIDISKDYFNDVVYKETPVADEADEFGECDDTDELT